MATFQTPASGDVAEVGAGPIWLLLLFETTECLSQLLSLCVTVCFEIDPNIAEKVIYWTSSRLLFEFSGDFPFRAFLFFSSK